MSQPTFQISVREHHVLIYGHGVHLELPKIDSIYTEAVCRALAVAFSAGERERAAQIRNLIEASHR